MWLPFRRIQLLKIETNSQRVLIVIGLPPLRWLSLSQFDVDQLVTDYQKTAGSRRIMIALTPND